MTCKDCVKYFTCTLERRGICRDFKERRQAKKHTSGRRGDEDEKIENRMYLPN